MTRPPHVASPRPVPHAAPCLALVLLLAGCIMPTRDAPAPAAVAETVAEEVAEPAPVPTITVTTDANVRAGPGTDHPARFWLATATEVAVTGRMPTAPGCGSNTRAAPAGSSAR